MIIKDNIYGVIKLDEVAEQVIHTKEFQRLRKVKQLGLNYMILPGANHTRYEHSLGVYHLAKTIIDKHNSKGEFATVPESKEFLMACLLHDIGHGPFSHTSEKFYGFNHEKMGIEILQNPNGEINAILRKYRLLQGTCDIINKTHRNPILNKLLSSGVDLDRLDYLNRDSFYSGVNYGKINISDVLECLKFTTDKFYFDEEHKLIAENFFMNRYYMFSEIYLNNDARMYEFTIEYILNKVKEHFQIEDISVNDILTMYDAKFETYIEQKVIELNDEKINYLWDIIQTNQMDKLKIVSNKEDADIIVPAVKKTIVDDKNTIFIYENSRFKKIQTSNSILNDFLIEKDEVYLKI